MISCDRDESQAAFGIVTVTRDTSWESYWRGSFLVPFWSGVSVRLTRMVCSLERQGTRLPYDSDVCNILL